MAQKPGTVVTLKCEACPRRFSYRLTKSPFRKKFCSDCAATRTFENKKRFDEKRKNDDIDRARNSKMRKSLDEIPNREVNPERMINAALKALA